VDIEGAQAAQAGEDPAASGETRRSLAKRLLGVGIGGAAIALVPQIASRANASSPPGTGGAAPDAGGSAAVTTTTPTPSTIAPPERPTDADIPLLVFSQSVEIAAYQLYNRAKDLPFSDDQRTVVEVVRQSHLAYAQALSGLLGREADNETDEALLATMTPLFTRDVATMLQAAYDLESTLVATNVSLIGQLVGTNGAAMLATFVTVEGRNGTVFADLMGSTDLNVLLVDNEADALTPAKG
jgi:hypothetical protein